MLPGLLRRGGQRSDRRYYYWTLSRLTAESSGTGAVKDYLLKEFMHACAVFQDVRNDEEVAPAEAKKAMEHFQWLLTDLQLIVADHNEPRINVGFNDNNQPTSVARSHVEKMYFALKSLLGNNEGSVPPAEA